MSSYVLPDATDIDDPSAADERPVALQKPPRRAVSLSTPFRSSSDGGSAGDAGGHHHQRKGVKSAAANNRGGGDASLETATSVTPAAVTTDQSSSSHPAAGGCLAPSLPLALTTCLATLYRHIDWQCTVDQQAVERTADHVESLVTMHRNKLDAEVRRSVAKLAEGALTDDIIALQTSALQLADVARNIAAKVESAVATATTDAEAAASSTTAAHATAAPSAPPRADGDRPSAALLLCRSIVARTKLYESALRVELSTVDELKGAIVDERRAEAQAEMEHIASQRKLRHRLAYAEKEAEQLRWQVEAAISERKTLDIEHAADLRALREQQQLQQILQRFSDGIQSSLQRLAADESSLEDLVAECEDGVAVSAASVTFAQHLKSTLRQAGYRVEERSSEPQEGAAMNADTAADLERSRDDGSATSRRTKAVPDAAADVVERCYVDPMTAMSSSTLEAIEGVADIADEYTPNLVAETYERRRRRHSDVEKMATPPLPAAVEKGKYDYLATPWGDDDQPRSMGTGDDSIHRRSLPGNNKHVVAVRNAKSSVSFRRPPPRYIGRRDPTEDDDLSRDSVTVPSHLPDEIGGSRIGSSSDSVLIQHLIADLQAVADRNGSAATASNRPAPPAPGDDDDWQDARRYVADRIAQRHDAVNKARSQNRSRCSPPLERPPARSSDLQRSLEEKGKRNVPTTVVAGVVVRGSRGGSQADETASKVGSASREALTQSATGGRPITLRRSDAAALRQAWQSAHAVAVQSAETASVRSRDSLREALFGPPDAPGHSDEKLRRHHPQRDPSHPPNASRTPPSDDDASRHDDDPNGAVGEPTADGRSVRGTSKALEAPASYAAAAAVSTGIPTEPKADERSSAWSKAYGRPAPSRIPTFSDLMSQRHELDETVMKPLSEEAATTLLAAAHRPAMMPTGPLTSASSSSSSPRGEPSEVAFHGGRAAPTTFVPRGVSSVVFPLGHPRPTLPVPPIRPAAAAPTTAAQQSVQDVVRRLRLETAEGLAALTAANEESRRRIQDV